MGNATSRAHASDARRFLNALFGTKPDGLNILLWTLQNKLSHWFPDVQSAIRFVEKLRDHDCYVGVGLSPKDYGPSRRCSSAETAGIVGLWADLDLHSEAHPKAALPSTVEEALTILPPELPPSIVVLTGNGAHAWWLLNQPWIFADPADRQRAVELSSGLQSLLQSNAASRGWAYDRLGDLARLLRVPGTFNHKDGNNPTRVELYSECKRRYNVAELRSYLDARAVQHPSRDQRESMFPGADASEGKPWSINFEARVPEDLLNRLMADHARFKLTWLRLRSDLRDASPLGYDMALANFGVIAGFTDQQIVDLIVHHRRLHGDRQRTRADYFERTIAKARTATEAVNLLNPARQRRTLHPEYIRTSESGDRG